MKLKIHLTKQSQPIKRKKVVNTYTKVDMFCVFLESDDVEKYPLINIFRIVEKSSQPLEGFLSVNVHLKEQSQPIQRQNVVNTYLKDGLFCLLLSSGDVEKYPLMNIFRVTEKR